MSGEQSPSAKPLLTRHGSLPAVFSRQGSIRNRFQQRKSAPDGLNIISLGTLNAIGIAPSQSTLNKIAVLCASNNGDSLLRSKPSTKSFHLDNGGTQQDQSSMSNLLNNLVLEEESHDKLIAEPIELTARRRKRSSSSNWSSISELTFYGSDTNKPSMSSTRSSLESIQDGGCAATTHPPDRLRPRRGKKNLTLSEIRRQSPLHSSEGALKSPSSGPVSVSTPEPSGDGRIFFGRSTRKSEQFGSPKNFAADNKRPTEKQLADAAPPELDAPTDGATYLDHVEFWDSWQSHPSSKKRSSGEHTANKSIPGRKRSSNQDLWSSWGSLESSRLLAEVPERVVDTNISDAETCTSEMEQGLSWSMKVKEAEQEILQAMFHVLESLHAVSLNQTTTSS